MRSELFDRMLSYLSSQTAPPNGTFDQFDSLFCPHLPLFARLIRDMTPPFPGLTIHESCWQNLAAWLIRRFDEILRPVLQANFTVFRSREANRSSGISDVEVQTRYLAQMVGCGLNRLLATKPLLRQLLYTVSNQTLAYSTALFQRLHRDKAEIIRFTGLPTTQELSVLDLSTGLSDPHCGGQTVSILTFGDNRRIVYKPRSLEPESALYSTVSFLENRGLRSTIFCPRLLEREGYGWMEYCDEVSHFSSSSAVENAAEGFGCLAAIWYVLGGSDLHAGNLMFDRRGPAIVDAETACGFDFLYESDQADTPEDDLWVQCLRHDVAERSLFGSGAFQAHVKDQKTDDYWNISVVASLFKKAAPSFSNEGRDWAEQYDSWGFAADRIASAIRRCLTVIAAHTDAFTEHVLRAFEGIRVRVVLRPTAFYLAALQNVVADFPLLRLTHEDCTPTAREQIAAISPVMPYDFLQGCLSSETDQLLALDVPYFSRTLSGTSIEGEGWRADLPTTLSFRALRKRLRELKRGGAERQEHLARLALTRRSQSQQLVRCGPTTNSYLFRPYAIEPGEIRAWLSGDILTAVAAIARRVGDSLKNVERIERQFLLHDVGRDDFSLLEARGYGLYSGHVGELVFLAAYADFFHDTDVRSLVVDHATVMARWLRNEGSMFVAEQPRGLLGGWQSLLYGLHVIERLGMVSLPNDLTQRLFMNVPNNSANMRHDLSDGIAGHLILWNRFSSTVAWDQLTGDANNLWNAGRKLMDANSIKSGRRRALGLAHGALGPAWASAVVYHQTGDDEFRHLALDLVGLDRKFRDARPAGQTENFGWCYGSAGRGVAHREIGMLLADDDLCGRALEACPEIPAQNGQFSDLSLCCGAAGYMACYLSLVFEHCRNGSPGRSPTSFPERDVMAFLRTAAENLESNMDTGLFKGIAGLGYLLLYVLSQGKLPALWRFH